MSAIEKFRNTLSREGYLAYYLAYGNGNKSVSKWKEDAAPIAGRLKTLINLFLLNDRVPAEEAVEVLGDDVVAELAESGILIRNDDVLRTDALVLISFNSILFFCECGMNPQVYFGNDSIALGTYQTPLIKGKSIDLCAGSAIQSMVAAQTCEFSQAVEINPKAATIAAFNIRLNNMSHKVKMTNQSLEAFAQADDESYDLVTFNPPLLPIPSPLFYPFVGDGGEDGLDVTRRILHLYIPKLTKTGTVEFIGCGLGKDGHPTFVDSLRPIFDAHQLSYDVHLVGAGKLEKGDLAYESTIVTSAVTNGISAELCHHIYALHYEKMDANEMYCFFIRAYRPTDGKQKNSVIRNSNQFLNWFVY